MVHSFLHIYITTVIYCFLGEVSTICDIFYPKFAAILSDTSILVSCLHEILKVTFKGTLY